MKHKFNRAIEDITDGHSQQEEERFEYSRV
jgi:hypothetical protein